MTTRASIRRRWRLSVAATLVAVSASALGTSAADVDTHSFRPAPVSFQACAPGANWAGPGRRDAPPEAWARDFNQSIDGELPAAVQAALDTVVGSFAERAPAVSAAVAIPGVGRWSAARGVARVEPREPLPDDARFQVASTTKTLTAAAVLQLQAEGKLSASQTIEPWFPDAPNARVTTVEHLLRHTSGLVSFNALPSWTLEFRQPREAIAMATAEPAQFCPGTRFAYTNTGYAMLGVIVERLDGRPLPDVFRQRIIEPLGLVSTALRHRGDGIAVVSGHVGGTAVEMPDGYATPFAAGGLASTARDLVTFWHAFLGGRVVAPEVVRSMFTAMAPMDPNGQMFYGRGVQLYDIPQGPGLMLGHSGGITGFTSVVAYLPADDMFVSVVFNDQQVPAEAGLWAVVRAVRDAR